MNKAQRKKISIRNLAKARAAKKKSGGKRRASAHKRPSAKRAGKRTIALRNLAKARAARRSRKARGGPKHKVKGFTYTRKAKRVHVKSHMSYEESPRKHRRRSSKRRRSVAEESPRKRSRRSHSRRTHSRKSHHGRRRLSMSKSAVAARRRRRSMASESTHRRSSRSRRRHSVRAHIAHRGSRRVHVKRHMSREASRRHSRRHHSRRGHSRRMSHRRGHALENALNATELMVGAFTGAVGYIASDALDRVLATHMLTGTAPSFTDNADGTRYPGLYNATAVLAPMNWQRWAAGVTVAAVPFVIAAWIKNGVGRSSLQFFGFGAGVRLLGKAVTDLLAMLASRYEWAARMYDGEARAAALKSGDATAQANLPTSGLGAAPGCGCVNCTTGVGACCRSVYGTTPQPAPAPTPPQQSNAAPPALPQPEQPAQPVLQPLQPAEPAQPAAPAVPRTPVQRSNMPVPRLSTPGGRFAAQASPLAGAPSGARSPYRWGASEDAAAE